MMTDFNQIIFLFDKINNINTNKNSIQNIKLINNYYNEIYQLTKNKNDKKFELYYNLSKSYLINLRNKYYNLFSITKQHSLINFNNTLKFEYKNIFNDIDNLILSPVYGKVVKIKGLFIQIYISQNDNHDIFSPIYGKINQIYFKNGIFKDDTFHSEYDHTGRLFIKMENIYGNLKFIIEVGKPQYITDTIKVSVSENDFLESGQKIGQIIIGSTAYIILPPNSKNYLKLNDKLKGGKTIVAKFL